MTQRIKFRIFDHHSNSFLPVENVGWTFKSMVTEKYAGISIVFPTGFIANKYDEINKKLVPEPLYEGDIINADKRNDYRELTITEGAVEWHDETGGFLVRYVNKTGHSVTIWINGLDNIEIVGNVYEK
jgi:hypothetical protein